MTALLAGTAGFFLVLFGAALVIAFRRSDRIQKLETQLSEQKHQLREIEERLEAKSRQAEKNRTQLDRARDELQKAKKKAFLLEQHEKNLKPDDDSQLDLMQEQLLQETQSQARRAQEETARATEESTRLREQLNRFKQETAEARSTLKSLQTQSAQDERSFLEKLSKLEKENHDLQDKLETAKRKSRTDSQVYKVTKSKLDLALEKIAFLEKSSMGSLGHEAKNDQGSEIPQDELPPQDGEGRPVEPATTGPTSDSGSP